jgi:hypothetical protein
MRSLLPKLFIIVGLAASIATFCVSAAYESMHGDLKVAWGPIGLYKSRASESWLYSSANSIFWISVVVMLVGFLWLIVRRIQFKHSNIKRQ